MPVEPMLGFVGGRAICCAVTPYSDTPYTGSTAPATRSLSKPPSTANGICLRLALEPAGYVTPTVTYRLLMPGSNAVPVKFTMNWAVTDFEPSPKIWNCPCNRAAGVSVPATLLLTKAVTSMAVMVAVETVGNETVKESPSTHAWFCVPVVFCAVEILVVVKNVRWSELNPLANPSHWPTKSVLIALADGATETL